jgi:hypothetical protein
MDDIQNTEVKTESALDIRLSDCSIHVFSFIGHLRLPA